MRPDNVIVFYPVHQLDFGDGRRPFIFNLTNPVSAHFDPVDEHAVRLVLTDRASQRNVKVSDLPGLPRSFVFAPRVKMIKYGIIISAYQYVLTERRGVRGASADAWEESYHHAIKAPVRLYADGVIASERERLWRRRDVNGVTALEFVA